MFILGFIVGLFFSFVVLFFVFLTKERIQDRAHEIKDRFDRQDAVIIDTRDPLAELGIPPNDTIPQ